MAVGAWPRYAAKTGPRPLITARLPKEHAAILRAHASRTSTPLQAVIRELVAEWVKVHQAVHGNPLPHSPPAVPAAPAIPSPAPRQQETGRSEPAAVLQAIDADREAAGKGPTFRD